MLALDMLGLEADSSAMALGHKGSGKSNLINLIASSSRRPRQHRTLRVRQADVQQPAVAGHDGVFWVQFLVGAISEALLAIPLTASQAGSGGPALPPQ